MSRLMVVVLVMVSASACQRRIVTRFETPKEDVVVLLPDPDTQAVGQAVVTSAGTSAELASERAATRVAVGHRPTAPFTLPETDVLKLFGEALAATPPAPHHFLLYFVFDSSELTPESKILLPEVLAFIKGRPVPDVTVIGHTDTTGAAQANFELGRDRATAIRDRLVAAGLGGGPVSIASHGEADLLVRTPDETLEPMNRRVEVSVR